jgi:thiaminase (transcriptional activator TenA)
MSFCTEAWTRAEPIRAAIDSLPFLRELQAGTLSLERFRQYIVQDSLYLARFSRALSLAAAKAPDAAGMLEFSHGAKVAVEVEQALHQVFFTQFGISHTDAPEPSPTCEGYTGFLLNVAATGRYGELVAAVLPCFWIYWDVGCRLKSAAQASLDTNPYTAWIETYADPGFGATTERVKALADAAFSAGSLHAQAGMHAAFRRACQYEWMFWDSAYRLEAWPVG